MLFESCFLLFSGPSALIMLLLIAIFVQGCLFSCSSSLQEGPSENAEVLGGCIAPVSTHVS